MGQSPIVLLQKQLFELKSSSRTLERRAKDFDAKCLVETRKIRSTIERGGDLETADLYAQVCFICLESLTPHKNIVKARKSALEMRRLASRLSSVACVVEKAMVMNQVSESMETIVGGLDEILRNSMDPVALEKMMSRFESNFKTLDAQTTKMSMQMDSVASADQNVDEARSIVNKVMDDYGLSTLQSLSTVPSHSVVTTSAFEDDLEARLENLKKTDS